MARETNERLFQTILRDREDGMTAEQALVHVRALAPSLAPRALRESVLEIYEPAAARPIVTVGDRVRDGRLREGIVSAMQPRPSAPWLDEQRDPETREHADAQWWTVLVMGGGAVLAPSPLLRSYGRASLADVSRLVEHASVATVRDLLELFPELRAVSDRRA